MMNRKFRAFFAWMLPESMQVEINPLINRLKKEFYTTDIRFTELEKLHITLRFLGNISKEESLQLVTSAKDALKNKPAFALKLTDIEFFPSQQSKKTLVATGPSNINLINLANTLEQVTQSQGFSPETHPFRPHITLARLRTKLDKENIATQFSQPLEGFVEEISLMQSDFTKEGTIYSPVWKTRLR